MLFSLVRQQGEELFFCFVGCVKELCVLGGMRGYSFRLDGGFRARVVLKLSLFVLSALLFGWEVGKLYLYN